MKFFGKRKTYKHQFQIKKLRGSDYIEQDLLRVLHLIIFGVVMTEQAIRLMFSLINFIKVAILEKRNATYSYDTLDNMTSSVIGTRTSSYHYNAQNLLDTLTSSSPGYGFSFLYDARGNIVKRGNQSLSFDLGNRMTAAPGLDTYVYDGFGRRVQATAADGTVTVTVYSPDGQLLYKRRTGGPNPAASTQYIYLHRHQVAEVTR